MTEQEKYVREHWERVSCVETSLNGWVICAVLNDSPRQAEVLSGMTACIEAEAWSAAADFTRQRLEEIRKVQEEIALVRATYMVVHNTGERMPRGEQRSKLSDEMMIWQRILAREQSALAELRKGMRDGQ